MAASTSQYFRGDGVMEHYQRLIKDLNEGFTVSPSHCGVVCAALLFSKAALDTTEQGYEDQFSRKVRIVEKVKKLTKVTNSILMCDNPILLIVLYS